MNKPNNTIPDAEMVPYIRKVWDELQKYLVIQRREAKASYDWSNAYELIDRKFGKADTDEGARKYIAEFKRIREGVSTQPNYIVKVISEICLRANILYAAEKAKTKKKGGHDADRKS